MTIDIDALHKQIREDVRMQLPYLGLPAHINREVARRLAARVVEERAKLQEARCFNRHAYDQYCDAAAIRALIPQGEQHG